MAYTNSEPLLTATSRPSLQRVNSRLRLCVSDLVAHRGADKLEDHYEIAEKLGEGAFGKVFRCRHRASGSERAVKIMEKDAYDEDYNEKVRQEFQTVTSLDHPNITRQYEMFEDSKSFYLVSDIYRGGELFDALEEAGRFSEEHAARLMNSLIGAVFYIHNQGLVHRDVKTENVLLNDSTKRMEDIKIIDFGLAAQYSGPEEPLTDIVGSPHYVSPQAIQGEPYGPKTDIWSCGVIAYSLLAGFLPFDGDSFEAIRYDILTAPVRLNDPVWDGVSESAKDFVTKLLGYEEHERPSAQEALQHPWLQMTRQDSCRSFKTAGSCSESTANALASMRTFNATGSPAMKQAAYALLASQFVPKQDREDIDEVFRVLDQNCSGRLSEDDVMKAYEDFGMEPLTKEEGAAILEKINVSGIGQIEYSEFVAACLIDETFLDDVKLQAAFAAFDTDKDGRISKRDFRKVLSFTDVDDLEIAAVLQEAVGTGDKEIVFEDFQRLMLGSSSASCLTCDAEIGDASQEVLEGTEAPTSPTSQSHGGKAVDGAPIEIISPVNPSVKSRANASHALLEGLIQRGREQGAPLPFSANERPAAVTQLSRSNVKHALPQPRSDLSSPRPSLDEYLSNSKLSLAHKSRALQALSPRQVSPASPRSTWTLPQDSPLSTSWQWLLAPGDTSVPPVSASSVSSTSTALSSPTLGRKRLPKFPLLGCESSKRTRCKELNSLAEFFSGNSSSLRNLFSSLAMD